MNFWFSWKVIIFDPRQLMLILLYQLIICRLRSQNLVPSLYIRFASNTTLGTSNWSPTHCLNCLGHKKKLPGSTPSASLSSYYTSYTSIFPTLRCSLAILFSQILVRIIFDTGKHFGFTGIQQGDWRGNTRVGREWELCKLSSLL